MIVLFVRKNSPFRLLFPIEDIYVIVMEIVCKKVEEAINKLFTDLWTQLYDICYKVALFICRNIHRMIVPKAPTPLT